MALLSRIKIWYQTMRRMDKVLCWTLVLSAILSALITSGPIQLLIEFIFFVSGAWAVLRIVQVGLRRAIWSLRNRLLVTYLFIAVVPILLIASLVALVLYTYSGQVAFYLVNSELERRAATLQELTRYLAQATPEERAGWARTGAPRLLDRFPGLELESRDGAPWVYPPGSTPERPPGWGDISGLVLKDDFLYLWANSRKGGAAVTALVPISQDYLADLAPNLGEVSVINFDASRSHAPKLFIPEGAEGTRAARNRLPDPVNRFDTEVRWGAVVPMAVWESPGRVENEILRGRTRISAIIDTIFAQRGNLSGSQGAFLSFLLMISVLFLIAELISLVIGVNISRTITSAVSDLYEGTQKVMQGDFSHRIEVKGADQVALLSQSFNRMTENVERLLAVSKEKERLQAELEIAREVQAQLYPKTVPKLKSLQLTAQCDPARTVSGDYYDYQSLGESRIAIALGDVAGKGISAALLMATLQSSLRTQLRGSLESAMAVGGTPRTLPSTSQLVSQLNLQLHANTSPEKFATFYFGVYSEATSTLTYTNAGHLPPILLRKGEASRLEVNGTVVGAFPFSRYQEASVQLIPGDLLICFTDGITEPENEYGEMFGEDRLIDVVSRNLERDNREIIRAVMDCVHEWTGSPELQDDMTLLLARRV